MEPIRDLQASIQLKRAACEKAAHDYYSALQRLLLHQQGTVRTQQDVPSEAEVEVLRQNKISADEVLQSEIGRLARMGMPQQLVGQTPANIPYLLFPVRVEARYITFQHVLYPLPPEHIIHTGDERTGTEQWRFQTDDDGRMTYLVPSFNHIGRANLRRKIENGTLAPASGQFIQQKRDRNELWIRIFPDDISLETHEKHLLPEEWEMGKAFWQRIWQQADPETVWMEMSAAISTPRFAWIVRSTKPENYVPGAELPPVPIFPEPTLKAGVYTLPPVARLLPERFVVRLYKGGQHKEFVGQPLTDPLLTGIDPTHNPFDIAEDAAASRFTPKDTALKSPSYMQWMFDLEAAERAGMAIRIDLNQYPEYDDGVDQIFVLGTHLAADAKEGASLLTDHFENHLFNVRGFGILSQGTPTNSSGVQKSAYELNDEEARAYFQSAWRDSSHDRTDESVLFKVLGIRPEFRLPNGHLTDMEEALQMNRLLWPATWGYYLLQFFTPQMAESERKKLQSFFVNHVSGRGILPCLRVNNQPYGIVPTTSFRHLTYTNADSEDEFIAGLWTMYLSKLDEQWKGMTKKLLSAANNAESGQRLDQSFLKMLGLNASSTTWNRHWLVGRNFQEMMSPLPTNTKLSIEDDPRFNPNAKKAALKSAGFNSAYFAEIANSYASHNEQLQEVLFDSLPNTEERVLEQMPDKAWNYLQWLADSRFMDVWNESFTHVPAGNGHPASKSGASLLAKLLRQATLRVYVETGLRIAEPDPGLWLLKAKDFELDHVNAATIRVGNPRSLGTKNKVHLQYKSIINHFNIRAPFELEPDRRRYFNKNYPATGSLTLADWLEQPQTPEGQLLQAHKALLRHFSQLPTARLSRLVSEHLDLCSHRLDAWMTGLVSHRLQKQRQDAPTGIHLGAFGYLLNLKPSVQRAVVVVPVEPEYIAATADNIAKAAIPIADISAIGSMGIDLSTPSDQTYLYLGMEKQPELRLQTALKRVEPSATQNGVQSKGFRHLPSLPHAATAAILQAGYLGHELEHTQQTMAINLNATRVRQAMTLLEGTQRGSSLAALLGFLFERLLHDRKLDRFLLDIRKKYSLQRTANADEAISTLTTIDGIKLLDAWRTNSARWLDGVPDTGNPTHRNAISQVAKELDDHFDALGDLLLSESVYQTAKGSPDKAAAALRLLNKGGQPITPEFIHPQSQGRTITHRVGIVFENDSLHSEKAWTSAGTPRSQLSPALNLWLSKQLPLPHQIKIRVTTPDGWSLLVKVSDLGIEPIDLLYAFPASLQDVDNSVIIWLIRQKAVEMAGITGAQIKIDAEDRTGMAKDDLTLFEVSSILTALQKIVAVSRPIAPIDFLLPNHASTAEEGTIDPNVLYNAVEKLLQHQGYLENTILSLRSIDSTENQSALRQAWLLGQDTARINIAEHPDEQRENLAAMLEGRLAQMRTQLSAISTAMRGTQQFEVLHRICEILYGQQLKILPSIIPGYIHTVKAVYDNRHNIGNATPDALDDWLREAALVRAPLQAFRQMTLLREVLQCPDHDKAPFVLQFPFYEGKQPWIGGQWTVGDDEAVQEDTPTLSLFLEKPPAYEFEAPLTGIMLDEWPEFIPVQQTDTGIAFQFNQPNTEPAQAILLAVSPMEAGNWDWEHLMGAVMETLEMSKKRLVTPSEIEAQNPALAHVLPAIVLPFMQDNQNVPVVSLPI